MSKINRNTGLRPRIFGVDAVGVGPVLLSLYHPTHLAFAILAGSIVILWMLEQYGIYITSLPPLIRWWLGSKNPDLHARETKSVW